MKASSPAKQLEQAGNGLLLCLLQFALSSYSWTVEYAKDDVPMLTLLLLLRQKLAEEGHPGITLLE